MAKMLDFSKAKKPTMQVKLPDESSVYLYTPSKGQLEELLEAKEQLESVADDDRESLDQLYDIASRMMSNNKAGREISSDELAGMLDISDIVVFFRAYTEFVAEYSSVKN